MKPRELMKEHEPCCCDRGTSVRPLGKEKDGQLDERRLALEGLNLSDVGEHDVDLEVDLVRFGLRIHDGKRLVGVIDPTLEEVVPRGFGLLKARRQSTQFKRKAEELIHAVDVLEVVSRTGQRSNVSHDGPSELIGRHPVSRARAQT